MSGQKNIYADIDFLSVSYFSKDDRLLTTTIFHFNEPISHVILHGTILHRFQKKNRSYNYIFQ